MQKQENFLRGDHRSKNAAPKFIMLSSINRFKWIFAKMVKYENEGWGSHWGVTFGGGKLGGSLLLALILNAKFWYHTGMFVGIFHDDL